MQSIVGAIKVESFLLLSVVNDYVETARHRDQKLVARFQGVAGAVCAAWYVVEIKDTFDAKRDVMVSFNKSEIPAGIGDLGQLNYLTLL
jgi:hypothetical protein